MSQGPASGLPLGQAPASGSLPVVTATDQDGIYLRLMRREQEYAALMKRDAGLTALSKRSSERATLTDRRGSVGRGSSR